MKKTTTFTKFFINSVEREKRKATLFLLRADELKRINYPTKLLRGSFIIMIPLVMVLVPFVYATSQTPQVKIDKNIDSEVYQTSSLSTHMSVRSSSNPKKIPQEVKPALLVEKVRSGIVQTIDNDNNSFMLKTKDTLLTVEYNASTTFYSGDGNKVDVKDIDDTMKIYVFGYNNSDASVMSAIKIVIANESRLQRK